MYHIGSETQCSCTIRDRHEFQRGDKDENTRYVRHYTALEDEEFIIVYGGEGPHFEYNITGVDSDEIPALVHQIVLGALTGKILVAPEQRCCLINFESMPMLGPEEVYSLTLGSHGDRNMDEREYRP